MIEAVEYHKTVLIQKEERPCAYFRYWGGLGDYLYFLTFCSPLLREKKNLRRVLAADVNPYYGGDPLGDLCRESQLIDEVWTRSVSPVGQNTYPREVIEQAENPQSSVELFRASIYNKILSGPGVLEFPVEELRKSGRDVPRDIISVPKKEEVCSRLRIPKEYAVLQVNSLLKGTTTRLSEREVRSIASVIPVPIVILRFPKHVGVSGYDENLLKCIPNVLVVDVTSICDVIMILKYSRMYVGIESFQLLASLIMGRLCAYFPVSDRVMEHFNRDLGFFLQPLMLRRRGEDWDLQLTEFVKGTS